MTYQLKGFVKIKPQINNAVGIVSQIGELSTHAQTFTRQMSEFDDVRWPDIAFVAFQSKNTTGDIPVPRDFYDHILELTDQCVQFCTNFQGQLTRLDVLNNLQASYFGTVADWEIGEILTSGGISIPEWINWRNNLLPINSIKVWFSDPAFRRQYSDYAITVIPPIDIIDDFFKPVADVKAALAARTGSITAQLIQTSKNGHPETVIRADDFEFNIATNLEYKPRVSWHTLIYGAAGDNLDMVKLAIRDYCLANSNYTLSQWALIFPDIFKTTEFAIYPFWDNIAIPNRSTQLGMFSPVTNPLVALNKIKSIYPNTQAAFVEENLEIFGHNHRSVLLAAIGGAENKNARFKISQYFPDYIDVGTNSVDFNRMEKNTQNWSYLLARLLIIAENPDKYTDLPAATKKMSRGGITYIAESFDNVLYMVATKATVIP